ncbi:MAG TPA: DinB family protein [Gemmatimonadaceae bacterium]|nr:DinB family protein [Gemmatimonadaceae bacterium]
MDLRDPEEATVSTAAVATSGATRPEKSEYLPYYERYISLVPEGDVISTLSTQVDDTLALLRGLPASVSTYRYAPDKWSVNEVVGHMADTERIFAARTLVFARNDPAHMPSMEQDDYIRNSTFDAYPLSELADELEAVRRSTVLLFKHLDEQAWSRRGVANNAEVSVRALAYIIAGHELHHRGVLESRYL